MFEFLPIRGYFQKVVKSDGRVVRNEATGLLWNDSGFDWTAKCSKFIGRVFKNWGPHHSSGRPGWPVVASGMEPTPAARSHPSTRAGGQDDVSYTNSLKLASFPFRINRSSS